MNPGKATAWLAAIRPKTLGLSIAPVLVGTSAAFAAGAQINGWIFLAALVTALLIQIGTNLHNDVADFEKGTDTPDRLGPLRAVAQGWLNAVHVRYAAFLCFILALLVGLYLVSIGGWPVFWLGLSSLLAGAAYSGGRWPISHLPLGELFVYLFFGLAAVMGSYYLQTFAVDRFSFLLASMLGLMAAAVLVVNNYRDREQDRLAGRRTLAVITQPIFSQMEYALLLLTPYGLIFVAAHIMENMNISGWSYLLLSFLSLPWALYLIWRLLQINNKRLLNGLLAQTAQLQVLFALLLFVGLCLDRGGNYEDKNHSVSNTIDIVQPAFGGGAKRP